jgi:hypothetical protein
VGAKNRIGAWLTNDLYKQGPDVIITYPAIKHRPQGVF